MDSLGAVELRRELAAALGALAHWLNLYAVDPRVLHVFAGARRPRSTWIHTAYHYTMFTRAWCRVP